MSKKVIAIIGPTGIGKTDLAISIAKMFNLKIISADAFQIYKDMNIGTNKPTQTEISDVSYYGINLVDVNNQYSIYNFQNYARNIIDESDKPVILVGGSMLYLDSVIYNYSLPNNFNNSNKYLELSNQELYDKLNELDPIAASSLHVNNRNRITTALNYFLQFHESIRNNNDKKTFYYDVLFIYIKPIDKWELNKQNTLRINKMFKMGWINEVKFLLNKYPNFLNYGSAKAIGYQQIANSIISGKDIDIQNIINKTNKFVKHQLSWYKKHEQEYLIINHCQEIDKIKNRINEFITK